MQVVFSERKEIAPGIWEYFFKPERSVSFVPGQYVSLYLTKVSDDPRGPMRTLTLTSLPTDKLISFVVKFPEPGSPYKKVLASLQPGSEAKIDDAMGDLVLPKDPGVPLVYIAGGIGMASYASMLKQLLGKKEQRNIFFFYAVRSAREQIFRDLISAYPLELKTLVISPNRLTGKQVVDTTPPDALIYISGSQKFVEGLRFNLEQLGVPRHQIVFDYYDGYTEL